MPEAAEGALVVILASTRERFGCAKTIAPLGGRASLQALENLSLIRSHAILARRQTALGWNCASWLMLPGILSGSLLVAVLAMFLTSSGPAHGSVGGATAGTASQRAAAFPQQDGR